ncbi:hypothetical protein STEG23_027373, partial [Scotinomys teguina]
MDVEGVNDIIHEEESRVEFDGVMYPYGMSQEKEGFDNLVAVCLRFLLHLAPNDCGTNSWKKLFVCALVDPSYELPLVVVHTVMLLPGTKGLLLLFQRIVTRTIVLQETIGKDMFIGIHNIPAT